MSGTRSALNGRMGLKIKVLRNRVLQVTLTRDKTSNTVARFLVLNRAWNMSEPTLPEWT